MFGTAIGSILTGVLLNGLVLLGVSAYIQQIIVGRIIVVAMGFELSAESRRRRACVGGRDGLGLIVGSTPSPSTASLVGRSHRSVGVLKNPAGRNAWTALRLKALPRYGSSRMDPLSDVVALLRPSTAISKPITGKGRWGVRYAAHGAPGFAVILKGACWIALEVQAPMRLEQGDFVLLPSSPAFTLSSDPGVECEPRDPTGAAVRHGDAEGDADFESLGGTFRMEQVNAPLLLALLPRVIHISATEGRTSTLSSIIGLIRDECAGDRPGKDMFLQRMLEVLLIEALRWRSVAADHPHAGLLNGLRDPGLARVLRALHADVRAKWTVAGLAKIAGLSRSGFAARFGEALGCGPIEYLARWRMALAKDALISGAKTLDRIADEIGYESASAFNTAFRKRFGCSPGKFARSNALAGTA